MAEGENNDRRATIINLDELVPRTIVVQLNGEEWFLPGDIDVETTIKIQQLLLDLADSEDKTLRAEMAVLEAESPEDIEAAAKGRRAAFDAQAQVTIGMTKEILGLFQVSHPDMEQLPFGAAAFRAVLGTVLVQLGFGGDEEEPAPEIPTAPKPKRSRAKSPSSPSS